MSMPLVELEANAVAASVAESPKSWNPAGALRKVAHGLFDPYRPELHYMRGPGPRWRARHAFDGASPDRG